MDKAKRLRQLEILENEPYLAIFNQIADLNDKLRALNGSVKAESAKEVVEYKTELNSLLEAILSLQQSVKDKDTIVNIPLDQLAEQIQKVEQAIKAIKEVKIPEFPSEFSLNEVQINELLFAIQTIPEFPIDELKKMVLNLEKAVKEIKLEVPNNEFDYDFLDEKFNKLIKAVKGVSIVVSGGGSSFPEKLYSLNSHTGSSEVRVYQENHVCSDNTSTTPLGADEVFTGAWQDCLQYQEVNVSISTDKNSATDGLEIQWSDDAVNVADTDKFTVYANAGTNYTPNPAFRYVRLKYTNGDEAQGLFHLMTILRRTMTGGSFHRITDTLKDDSDGRLNLSVLKLRTAQNNYVSGSATTAGNFKVSLEEHELDGNPLPVASPNYTIRLAESGVYTYIGEAVISSNESDNVWRIKRIDETSGMSILWADGNSNFDNVWSDYLTLTYA